MYIDISSHNGAIDWKKVNGVNGVILRATTKNNKLDVRFMENYNGILQNISAQLDELSVYKFSYARTYAQARTECAICLRELAIKGIRYDKLYVDLEAWDGRDYTRDECDEVLWGYYDQMTFKTGFENKFAIYTNYNYLKNILNPYWKDVPIWLARWGATVGDTMGANVVLWQFSNKGKIDGITTDVDLSERI